MTDVEKQLKALKEHNMSSDDATNFQPSFTTPQQNIVHNEPWGTYSYQPVPLTRTYKCPCKGEFFQPALKNGKQVCPFCSKSMKGLNP